MKIFDIFKRHCPLRPFETNISDFSEAEITEWMERVKSNPNLLPPSKSDMYISRLISRLNDEKGINLLDDITKNGVRNIIVSIERGERPDVVGIQYALYQPNVAYITTAMFPFAGMSFIYKQYCMNLESSFPFLQMGAQVFLQEIPGFGNIERDTFAIRTMIPLVGAEDDYKHLLNALKCLPIYGYDTRDGYPHMNLQPYPGKTGLNIQLEKLVNIYKSKSVSSVMPTENLIFGTSYAKITEIVMPAEEKIEIIRQSTTNKGEFFTGNNSVNISFITPNMYPSLWIALIRKNYTIDSEEEIKELLNKIGAFSYPSLQESNMQGILFLQSWFSGQEDNKIEVVYGIVGCCPNEFDLTVMAWQIAKFQSILQD